MSQFLFIQTENIIQISLQSQKNMLFLYKNILMNNIQNKMSGPQYIKNRMRKEVRYSALVTMTMRLLKVHKIFKLSEQIAKVLKIKNQKNYSIICLRLSLLFRELTSRYSKEATTMYIFDYLRLNLRSVMGGKMSEKNERIDKEIFLQNGQQLIFRNLSIFESVLLGDLNNVQFIKNTLLKLYEPTKNGKYLKQQIQSLNNLIFIFFKYTKGNQNVQQYKNLNQCKLQYKQPQTESVNDESPKENKAKQTENQANQQKQLLKPMEFNPELFTKNMKNIRKNIIIQLMPTS